MTTEEALKIDNWRNRLRPLMTLLHYIDFELNHCRYGDSFNPSAVKRMIDSMFYESENRETICKQLDDIINHYDFNEEILEKFGKNIKADNRPLADVLKLYEKNGLIAFVDRELFENFLSAREKFLLDLKNTFESLLAAIPSPQFPDNKEISTEE